MGVVIGLGIYQGKSGCGSFRHATQCIHRMREVFDHDPTSSG